MANILIVDDSAFMRLILKDIVRKAGHVAVGEAEDGLKAVQLYLELSPELVIMNIVMPELNGILALQRIKKRDPKAKVIICSATGNQYYVIEAIQSGALDFIIKPFDESRMIHSIKRALQLTI